MGVEYSYGVGYGFAGTGDTPVLPRDEWYDGEMDAWLKDHGYDKLASDTGGDQWSGPLRWAIVIKGTMHELDRYNESGVVVDIVEPPLEAIWQLAEARDELSPGAVIGWKFFADVF